MSDREMEIRQITSKDYDSIRIVDFQSFDRKSHRSKDNIKNLCLNYPKGCLLGLVDGIPVGYVIATSLGKVGFLGPLGIIKKNQNSGLGRLLVQESIRKLKEDCQVIGLETVPKWGKNIAFFTKLGFQSYLPSRFMIKNSDSDSDSEMIANSLVLGKNIKKKEWPKVIDDVKHLHSVDCSSDVDCFLRNYPSNILFYIDSGVKGFIAYHEDFSSLYICGVALSNNDETIFKNLVDEVERLKWSSEIKFQFQVSYARMTKVLLNYGFIIKEDVSCMVLQDSNTSSSLEIDSSLFIRPWWA